MSAAAKDHVYVGMDGGTREYLISPQMVQTYANAVCEHHPWYTGPSAFGGPVAPALIRHSEMYVDRRWYLPNLHGNLHAKQEWNLYAPILVGEKITAHSVVMDRYIKRGRDYVVDEVLLIGSDGRVCARSRTHQSFLLDTAVTGQVFGKEREKDVGRRFVVGQGESLETLTPLEKLVDQDMCIRYSGPGKSYHTDREAAKELGFPEVVVQGMLSVCFLSELMTKRFGEGWFCGGKMNVNLVNVLWMDETVTARGVVKEITPEGGSGRQRAHLEVWCQKADGTVITVGNASAVVS
ncbi:MAG: MaoC family dehydratase N-terminal domain-containing protein [Deltaproteobacteria bacterium]|nr:MaoC family dehydratase N-terminal domain-containing protein [Deltaproteobacteria bacterium]